MKSRERQRIRVRDMKDSNKNWLLLIIVCGFRYFSWHSVTAESNNGTQA